MATRWKVARLTAAGRTSQWEYADRIVTLEKRSVQRFGAAAVAALRADLERLAHDPDAVSPLMRGLDPYPANWRADVGPPETLPDYPMVLHRGGFPDGR
ncbi:MAG: hypothetical protein ABR922_24240 [Streptosporangiaceae bacterium]|jgi:hypothetical protein